MLYPKIEDCIENASQNKYVLVSMVAKRAKELNTRAGGHFASGKEKEISYAMREVIDHKLVPVMATGQNSVSK